MPLIILCTLVLLNVNVSTVTSTGVISEKEINPLQETIKNQTTEGTPVQVSIKPSKPTDQTLTSPSANDKIEKLEGKLQTLEGKIEKLESEKSSPDKNENSTHQSHETPFTENAKNTGTSENSINKISNQSNVGGKETISTSDRSQTITTHEFKSNDKVKYVETRGNKNKPTNKYQNGMAMRLNSTTKPLSIDNSNFIVDNNWKFLDWFGNLVTKEFGFFVKMSAIISNVVMILTPLPSIIKVANEKTTGNLSTLPYLMLLLSTALFSLYGYLASKTLILMSNGFGFLMSIIYVYIFHRNCQEMSKRLKLFRYYKIKCWILASIILSFIFLNTETFTIIIGVYAAVSSFLSYAAPLESLPRIFKERDSSCIPIEISLGNFWSCIFMLSYGFTIWDHFVIVPNFLGVLVGSLQLGVLLVYPRKERGFSYIDDNIHASPMGGTKLV